MQNSEPMQNSVAELVQLEISALDVGYDDIPVLNDIHLILGNGQIGCLLGPSGCGKSTLLKILRVWRSVTPILYRAVNNSVLLWRARWRQSQNYY